MNHEALCSLAENGPSCPPFVNYLTKRHCSMQRKPYSVTVVGWKLQKRTRYICQNVWRHPCWHLSTLDSIYAWISDVRMISGRGWGHQSSSYPGSYHQGAVRVKTVPLIGRRRMSISQLCVHFTIVRPFHNPHVHFLSAAHQLGSGWLAADMIGGMPCTYQES